MAFTVLNAGKTELGGRGSALVGNEKQCAKNTVEVHSVLVASGNQGAKNTVEVHSVLVASRNQGAKNTDVVQFARVVSAKTCVKYTISNTSQMLSVLWFIMH